MFFATFESFAKIERKKQRENENNLLLNIYSLFHQDLQMARMANPWFSPYSEIYKLTREKNQGSLRPTSGPQEHLATCQHTTVNVWSFRCLLPPSRAFSNQFLHFCPGSHLQILFTVEMLRGVFSRLFHSDLLNGDKKKSPHSPFV